MIMSNQLQKKSHKKLFLKKNEERRLKAGHLWVYSNEIDTKRTPLNSFTSGELVNVFSHNENCLGSAYINPHSLISARIICPKRDTFIDEKFLTTRIDQALALRERLYTQPYYRLIYGESDQLPGVIVDRFNDVLVIQINTAGMDCHKDLIVNALKNRLQISTIVVKNDSPSRAQEGLELYVETVQGIAPEHLTLTENGLNFLSPFVPASTAEQASNQDVSEPDPTSSNKQEFSGQKTGWFYDHRMSRSRLGDYVKGKKVLDVFSYVGAWGIQAAMSGAEAVTFIDSSKLALHYVDKNAEINQLKDKIDTLQGDAFQVLKQLVEDGMKFDVIVLDPPALIKRKKDLEKGTEAYRQLNRLAMELLSADGILVSCSCSYHLTEHALQDILLKCSRKLGKHLQILERGQQAPDHPIHPAIPETAYIKTFFTRVVSRL